MSTDPRAPSLPPPAPPADPYELRPAGGPDAQQLLAFDRWLLQSLAHRRRPRLLVDLAEIESTPELVRRWVEALSARAPQQVVRSAWVSRRALVRGLVVRETLRAGNLLAAALGARPLAVAWLEGSDDRPSAAEQRISEALEACERLPEPP